MRSWLKDCILQSQVQEAFRRYKKYGHEVEIHFMENPYAKGWFWLTVHDRKATKDKAILELI